MYQYTICMSRSLRFTYSWDKNGYLYIVHGKLNNIIILPTSVQMQKKLF